VSNFNYTLTDPLWKYQGNGTLCLEKLELPADLPIEDGTPASIQVITVSKSGSALYNCANIVFKADAKTLSGDECKTEGVTYAGPALNATSSEDGHGDHGGSGSNTTDSAGPSTSSTPGNAGSATGVNRVALSSVVALAVAFVFALSA
jgi:hypothetical protein